MITFDNISKSYGTRTLFDGVTFNVGKGEKIGLVGRNGHGKTTLMRIVTEEESPDDGRLSIPKNYKIGFLQQHIAFTKKTVIDEVMSVLPGQEETARWKGEKFLTGLGFTAEDMLKEPSSFSGGYQVRMTLTKAMLGEPDMLLLDEPTNYLDIQSIRWLKSFLNSWQGELIVITHDRQFMDDIITHTVGIHRCKVRKIPGKTDKFYEQIAKDEEIYEKTRVNDEQKRKEMEQYITRFRAKARLAGLVQSRIKALNKMEKLEKLEQIRNLEFTFRYKSFISKQVMRAENINFGYPAGDQLIKDFSIIVGSNDKIGVIGKNGKGKSTLLRILAGMLKPDSGKITLHTGAALGYYEQTNVSSLDPEKTIEEEIQSVSENLDRTKVRSICGSMLFPQDAALKKISLLSGGEKSRVMLGKVIATPLNLIMLDEPTNHLDMDSCDGLMEALDDFNGAIIMITHNEMFLHALATRLIIFQGDAPFVFDGTYAEFLEKIGWSAEEQTKKNKKKQDNKKDVRKIRSEINGEKNKILKPLQEKIESLENKIHDAEIEIKNLNDEAVQSAVSKDGSAIAEIGRKIAELNELIEKNFAELESKSALFNEKSEEFAKRLNELGDD